MHLPAVLVTTVYLAALAVALREPSEHLLAGAVVLLALCARTAARSPSAHALVVRRWRDRRSRTPAVVDDPVAAAVAPVTPG